MKPSLPAAFAIAALITLGSRSTAQWSFAQDQTNLETANEASPARGPHLGRMRAISNIQVETVLNAGGLQIFLFSTDGQPISVERARGVVTVSTEGNAKRYRYDLFPAEDNSLKVDINLSRLSGQTLNISYQLVGLSERTIAFREVSVLPASQTQKDAVAIARQRQCPVSGKPLGSMGKPVAVDVNGGRLFVCCASCVNVVKSNPAKYAKSTPRVEVAAISKGDAEKIARQGKCPVMDEPLGSMGQPVKLLVGSKPVYLCCKGCIKKVQAEPDKYLAKVAGATTSVTLGAQQVRPGVFRVTDADKSYIEAQQICPVMDEPLSSMGGPYKVNAGGKALYICCPGCAKKVADEPQKWLSLLVSRGVEAPAFSE